jgi:hypothetical protein
VTIESDDLLEALFNERDHLHLQVSLEADSVRPGPDKLHALFTRLAEVEDEIGRRWTTSRTDQHW